MNKPLVSIIVPVWNSGNVSRRIVSSILDQSFKDFELLLVDDGSTDDTLSIIRSIAKTDSRIRVFTKENGGPSSARNLGLDKARGKFIQFFDSDDDVAKDSLALTMDSIEGHDLLISGWQIDLRTSKKVINNYKQIQPKPQLIDTGLQEYVLKSLGNSGELYNLWNKLFRADIIRNNKLRFRENLHFGEDLLFSLDFFRHAKSMKIIPDVTYYYQTNSQTSIFSSSSINPDFRLANDQAIVAFAGPKLSMAQKDLLNWLRWRWLMSYWSVVVASNNPFRAKRQLIKQFSPANLPFIKSPRQIGVMNYLYMILAYVARFTTFTSLFVGWLMKMFAKSVIVIKTNLL